MDCATIRDELLELLYDEAPPATRARVEAHLSGCPACREELASLRRVRGRLSAWRTPELRPARSPRRSAVAVPLWLAAAAGLVLGLGTALATARLDPGHADLERRLAQHQAELAALRTSVSNPPDRQILDRVEKMIHDSETRNAVLLSASLADLADRADVQRRYDLARVSASLSYLDGKTGEQLARTSELMGYVLQASDRK